MSIELWRTRPYANELRHVIAQMYEQTSTPFTSAGSANGGTKPRQIHLQVTSGDTK